MRILRRGGYLRVGRTPQSAAPLVYERQTCRLQRRGHSATVDSDPSCGGTSPNSPRAGRQQGQASSSRYAGGPPMCPRCARQLSTRVGRALDKARYFVSGQREFGSRRGGARVAGWSSVMCTHSPEQRLWPVWWQLNLMIVVVRRFRVVLHPCINYHAPQTRSRVPVATNSQVKRSRLPAWRAPCPEP